ncbi:MAG: Uma2 family endonuclease [Chloroflexia bacterium]|nr:Uma2 family endonuclease [Chloroflexia bacterium]
MVVGQRMTEEAYQRFVLSTMEARWELHDGVLVEKPGRTWEHGAIVSDLGFLLQNSLDRTDYRVFFGLRVRRPPATIFVPDVMVVPTSYGDEFRDQPDILAIFAAPLPLVVEGWSPLMHGYDVDAKLPVYKERGDLEIWRIHPYERTLTRWVRQSDGSYRETLHRGGTVSAAALPNVTIDLDSLFDV